jgi:hypothetical protein
MEFAKLTGKIITSIDGLELGSAQITFHCADSTSMVMLHHQNCCENVSVEDIAGDVSSILNVPILSATEDTGPGISREYAQDPDPAPDQEGQEGTWTFYNIRTVKGYVNIRWLGTSNGYYSESVDCEWSND